MRHLVPKGSGQYLDQGCAGPVPYVCRRSRTTVEVTLRRIINIDPTRPSIDLRKKYVCPPYKLCAARKQTEEWVIIVGHAFTGHLADKDARSRECLDFYFSTFGVFFTLSLSGTTMTCPPRAPHMHLHACCWTCELRDSAHDPEKLTKRLRRNKVDFFYRRDTVFALSLFKTPGCGHYSQAANPAVVYVVV
ncbi:hypothetical protein J6590_058264 [Homalodisca vitripennis]|nr:hypothetical protein J6590_058264 [Homalodisca vitripennis]